jgi:hypothetical protein
MTDHPEWDQHDLWLTRCEQILHRDVHRCRNCGGEGDLLIHHRQYHVDIVTGERFRPWDYEDRFLITLCVRCHNAGHTKFSIPTFKMYK